MATGGAGPRLLDLRSGGWLLLLTALLVLLVGLWLVPPLFRSDGGAIGDGVDVASYGFDLKDTLVDGIVAAGLPRDGVPSLDDPEVMAVEDVAAFNEAHRGKYLVSDDRVIGLGSTVQPSVRGWNRHPRTSSWVRFGPPPVDFSKWTSLG